MRYTLEYIQSLVDNKREWQVGNRWVWHDTFLKQWQLKVQLEEKAYWFLTVFVNDDGTFCKYSLDEEAADDSHYQFVDEAAIRNEIYQQGDEKLLLDEVLTRYARENGGNALYKLIKPYITFQITYRDWDWDD